MNNSIFSFKNIALAVAIIATDLIIYISFALFLMGYDDFYDESEGEYWSLASMTLSEKLLYIGLNIWHVVNLLAIAFILFKIVKYFKNKISSNS